MSYVVDSCWDGEDDQELLDFLGKNMTILSSEEISNLDMSKYNCIFCPTNLVQDKLKSKVIPSYPEALKDFYGRRIQAMTIEEYNRMDHQFAGKDVFIKPFGSSKLFDAQIFSANTLLSVEHFSKEPKIYVCEVVKFVNEYRIFYGNGKIYGVVDSSEYIEMLHRTDEKFVRGDFGEFVFQLLNKCLEEFPTEYLVIDVGMTEDGIGNGGWKVVECNPPFSLSSYGFAIDKYVRYCERAWATLSF